MRRCGRLLFQALKRHARDAEVVGGGTPPAPAAAHVRQQWTSPRRDVYVHFEPRGGGRFGGGGGGRYPHHGLSQGQRRLLAAAGVGGAAVYVALRQEVPYTGRMHAVLLGVDAEREMGQQTFAAVLGEARAAGTLLPAAHPAVARVRAVGRRIAAVASDGAGAGGGFQAHMRGLDWEFAVVASDQVNAFVVPGGKVVVFTGLLRLLRSDDELAAVLAHEVAHVVARHAAERVTQSSLLELGRMVAYWGFGLPIPAAPLAAVFFLPNSRKAESEADAIGVQLAARACFEPGAAARVFRMLEAVEAAAGGGAAPSFLRTHPAGADRAAAIEALLPKARALGEREGCGDAAGVLADFRGRLRAAPRGGGDPWG